MPLQLVQGHTYAIGLGARSVPAGSEVDLATRSQGWSYPAAYQAPALGWNGWAPVVYYAAARAPIAPPSNLTAYEVIAFRSGPTVTVYGYAGEVSPLQPFGDVLWTLDLQAPPDTLDLQAPPDVARSFVADPDGTVKAGPAVVDYPPEPSGVGVAVVVAGVVALGVVLYVATRR